MLRTFKFEFAAAISFFAADALFRIAFSVMILYLFQAVNDNNLKMAYVYTAIMFVLWYCSQLLKQSGCVVTYILASQMKSSLAMLLYAKISKMTTYDLKSTKIGKVTNLLATDLGVIEQRLVTLLWSPCLPCLHNWKYLSTSDKDRLATIVEITIIILLTLIPSQR